MYNSALAFALVEASINVAPNRGPYCFRIYSQIYHRMNPVGERSETNFRYAQLYFIDSKQVTLIRADHPANGGCDQQLMKDLDAMLREVNPYAKIYKSMNRVLLEEYRQAERKGKPQLAVAHDHSY